MEKSPVAEIVMILDAIVYKDYTAIPVHINVHCCNLCFKAAMEGITLPALTFSRSSVRALLAQAADKYFTSDSFSCNECYLCIIFSQCLY